MANERVLVTGGAGFIGSFLCERLLADGHEVLCVDNFFTGRRRTVAHLIGNPLFELMRHDVTLPLFVEVDRIFNLACPASPVHYQFDPVQTTKVSVHGAINMLGLARRMKGRSCQASTSEVYGDPRSIRRPRTTGAGSTRSAARLLRRGQALRRDPVLRLLAAAPAEIKVARIFNTYGPRMHANDGRVVSNFVVQALKGEPITIYGDGAQTRSFCYVDDLVDGLVRMMATPAR
jgi:UDP-glucuronate decarboxylase